MEIKLGSTGLGFPLWKLYSKCFFIFIFFICYDEDFFSLWHLYSKNVTLDPTTHAHQVSLVFQTLILWKDYKEYDSTKMMQNKCSFIKIFHYFAQRDTVATLNHPINKFASFQSFSPSHNLFMVARFVILLQNLRKHVLDSSLQSAMEDELAALGNEQYLIDFRVGKYLVGGQMGFFLKYDPNGTINRYKA